MKTYSLNARFSRFLLCFCALFAANQTIAADYEFDKVHTQIWFAVSHQGFSTSRGTFTDFDGGFTYDPEQPEKSSVEVEVQTASVDFNDDTWNEHIRDKNWLNVSKHPAMSFKSTSVAVAGDNELLIEGVLTMLGTSKPITLSTNVNKVGLQFGKKKAGFSAVGKISRSEWGMSTYVPLIGDEIEITIEVEGNQTSD